MSSIIAFLQAHQVMATLAIYWFLSGIVGAMPAPTANSSMGYQFLFKFTNIFVGNLLRALSTKVEQSPNWKDAVNKLSGPQP